MSRGMPKVYLRMDVNIDQHPDIEGMVLLICAAHRQTPRGRFSEKVALRVLGTAKRLREFTKPRPGKTTCDLVAQPDGTLYLDGWDEWQEGDLTVTERVSRLRAKRNAAVPLPLHTRIETTAVAVAVTDEQKNEQGTTSPPAAAGSERPALKPVTPKASRPTWLTPFGGAWRERWGAESEPPWAEMAQQFAKPAKDLGADELATRWGRFLLSMERSEWARPSRFIQGLGQWGEQPGGLALARVDAVSPKAAAARTDADGAIKAGLRGR